MARQGEDEVSMALDLASGKTLRTKSFPTPYTAHPAAVKHGKGPKSTPIVAEGTACFLGVDARFSCHDAESGEVLWTRDFSDKSAPEETFCGSAVSPLVSDGLVFIHLGDDRAGRVSSPPTCAPARKSGDGRGRGRAMPRPS